MLNLIHYGNSSFDTLLIILFYLFAILTALILHEVAHGWVAVKCGDPTPQYAGRLSLNPARHLDPLGVLCFLLVGFGWAVPVPINPNNFRHPKRGCVLVSLAGIATNLLLAFIASFFFVLLYQKSVWCYLFEYMMLINIVLATFNLLPIAPLDGFNLLASCAPQSGYVRWMRENRLLGMILLLVIIYFTNFLQIAQSFLCGLFLDFWSLIL